MRLRRLRLRSVVCVLAVLVATAAGAREITAQEAAAQAQHESGGKVLSVQVLNVGKRKIYRIKVLTHDGKVRVVQVAAEQ